MKRSLCLLAAMVSATPALAASSNGGDPVASLLFLGVILAGYFFPTIIAAFRGHHNALAIFLLNLLLGWSGLGWIGALVWAATAVAPKPQANMIRITHE
jgi:hypothetical protein